MPKNTTNANAARTRAAGEKKAQWLRERGWLCVPPEDRTEPQK